MNFAFNLVDAKAVIAMQHYPFTLIDIRDCTYIDLLHFEAVVALEAGATFKDWINAIEAKHPISVDKELLRLSFNFNISRAQHASDWADLMETKEIFPFLRYVALNDEFVDPMHQKMDGTVKHIDDTFWNTFFPPNAYSCQCGVEALTEDEVNDENGSSQAQADIDSSFVPQDLRTNFGSDLKLWKKWLRAGLVPRESYLDQKRLTKR